MRQSHGWLFGFFIVLAPFLYVAHFSLIGSLIHCIIGLAVAITIEVMAR